MSVETKQLLSVFSTQLKTKVSSFFLNPKFSGHVKHLVELSAIKQFSAALLEHKLLLT